MFTETDCGLISVAFAPDFPVSQQIYLGYCTTLKSSQIARFAFDLPYDEIVASEELVIANPEPAAVEAWHNVGSIGFEPSACSGRCSGKDDQSNGQDLSSNLGKLLRIVPKQVGLATTPRRQPVRRRRHEEPDITPTACAHPGKACATHRDTSGLASRSDSSRK